MRLQEMIKYEKRASARPTFNIFKSDFPFLTDHVRPSGTQNKNKKLRSKHDEFYFVCFVHARNSHVLRF